MNNCCICDTRKYSKKYRVIGSYILLRCSNCGLIYLESGTDPQEFIYDAKRDLNSGTKEIEYWSFPDLYARHFSVFEKYFKERFSRCLTHNPSVMTMFDIGSGYGFWMDYCRRKGLRVKGIDVSKEAVDYGKSSLNLDIEFSPLADYRFEGEHDLYNLCDVLEHFADPNRELQIIRNHMKNDSLLYVQVPDVLGLKIPYKHNLGLPHHNWQFNYKTLKRLLEKNGFKILKKWHGIMGVIGNYERSEVNAFMKLKMFLARNLNIGNRLSVLCKRG